MIVLEILGLRFGNDGWSKGTEPFAMLDASVEHVLHVGQPGMRNNGTIS